MSGTNSITGRDAISGLVLAGGRGTRMGNVDKGLQPFGGATMAAQVAARLAPQVAAIAISANRNLDAYAGFGVPVWPDDTPGFPGPLAGLATGLRRCETDYLLSAPCDSPFLPADLAARLQRGLVEAGADAAVAVTEEDGRRRVHPVFCLAKRGLAPLVDAYLAEGGRRMDGWHARARVAEVLFEDGGAFRNINTLDELRALDHGASGKPRLDEVARCVDGYDPEALPVRDAQRIIGEFVAPVRAVEQVALRAALGRVLARDIVSPINVPAHDNSAMDGYALRGADLLPAAPLRLAVAGIAYAGRPFEGAVQPGQCVRIMTGAVMPAGCDSVVPQECVSVEEAAHGKNVLLAPGAIRAGDNRRLAGEDLAVGGVALAKGRVVRPSDLGLMASLGVAEVPVQRRLRVAFFSTGDELRSIGQALEEGCVYDSNRYTIYGMLQRLGCDVIDMGVVRDDPQALESALRDACENADAIITSGGVSVGAADYTRDIMARLGDVAFWKLAMRPGRPLAFGRIASNGRSAFLFGLPGNPVAVMVSFYFFARAALLRMMGADAPLPLLRARSLDTIRKKPGRTEFQRAVLARGADGQAEVRITGAQGSGILRSMSEANCMVVLHDEQGNVQAGEMVDVVVFEGLV
ncbi:molybdenum cofactor guanylyltransferase MobA [Massilia forsythiae]|uniref:Molybdenum cofactor guanylyltransferase n=1 Tax=Massilia forsythiae TaxID=2728020 RepID=A0A7Z2ZSU7_9BURK|nr:gephyrin-like molybdotransferase Glp [Massilia forsythiae]QJE00881.1 molybdenum cofactor guanylyltransferase MobA [Massilia forsythiae]